MSNFKFEILGQRNLQQAFDRLKSEAPVWLMKALNKSARKTKDEIAPKAASNFFNIAAERIGKNMTLRLASATKGKFDASVKTKEWDRPGLINFNASQDTSGVSYQVERGKGKSVKSAFIQSANKGRQVFKRRGKARLPIDALKGPSIPVMLAADTVSEKIIQDATYETSYWMYEMLDKLAKEFEKD